MPKQKRLTVLSMAVLLALLVAAIVPSAALADDGAPPPPDTPVVEEPSADTPAVDEPVAEEPAAEEPAADAPVVDAAAADEPVADEAVPPVDEVIPPVDEVVPPVDEVVPPMEESLTVPEILADVPAGTDVVVLGTDGQPEPLTSLAAADAILTSDPIWCKAGTNPGSVTAGDCTAGYASVTELVANIGASVGDGTIFFTNTYTPSAAEIAAGLVTINSAALGALDALTIQGGWNGQGNLALFGGAITAGTFSLSGVTTFTLPVQVLWDDKLLTINDIKFNGINSVQDAALMVQTTGDVVLNRVVSSNNNMDSDGTAIDAGGAYIYTTGNVTVNDSTFNTNKNAFAANAGKAYGLTITSDKDVTLNNVTANYNQGDGVDIYDNTTGPTSVTVSNSTFNYNTSTAVDSNGDPYGNGLWMDYVQGDVTLNDVTAMYNSNNGVEVGVGSRDGTPGNGTTGNIYVNGGTFAFNGQDGLHLTADGNITLNGVNAYYNGSNGAELCAGGDVEVNGGNYYYNYGGLYIKCAQNVYSYYGNWWGNYYGYYGDWWGNYYGWWGNYWDNYYGWYGWGYPSYYWGFYDGNWWDNHFAIDGGGDVYVTIENIYVDGYFIPDYYTYVNFFNSYYYGWGWGWWGWERPSHWYMHWYYLPPWAETAPLTVITTPLTEEELPAPLPEGKTFADAFELTASGGSPGEVADVSFNVPADAAADQTFTVLSWDGTAWVDVPSEIVDGKVVFKVGASGTFALVTP